VLAADLGFADQAHLCRTVRTHVGHTPTAVRRLLADDGEKSLMGKDQVTGVGVLAVPDRHRAVGEDGDLDAIAVVRAAGALTPGEVGHCGLLALLQRRENRPE
jgi:hypothetical protein